MTIWSTILLLTIIAYSFVLWIRRGWDLEASGILTMLPVFTLTALFCAYLVPLLPSWPWQGDMVFWSEKLAVCACLANVAEITRRLKPLHYQYPKVMTLIPFLLLTIFPFMRDSDYLTGLLLNLVFLAGILSLWITSLTLFRRLEKPGVLMVGVISITAAFVLEWVLPHISSQHPWTVHVTMSASIPMFVNAFTDIKVHLDS